MPTTACNDSIRIRVNKELKKEASELLSSMGLNFSDFFRISLLKLVNDAFFNRRSKPRNDSGNASCRKWGRDIPRECVFIL